MAYPIKLGSIQNTWGTSGPSGATLNTSHPEASNCKMSHFRIEQVLDNAAHYKWVFCTGNDEGWGTPHYSHNRAWTNMTNATYEDDCSHGTNDYQSVVTLRYAFTWTNFNRLVANKMMAVQSFYATNTFSSMEIDWGANFDQVVSDTNDDGPYQCCMRFGGEAPGVIENDVFYYNYKWADGINVDAVGYNVLHQCTLTMT